MSKVALTALLLVAIVAFATATTFTTTVTTTTDNAADPHFMRCMSEMQGRQFEPCQRYMKGLRLHNGEEDDVLEMSTENPQRVTSLTECCKQLRTVSPDCRCDVIKDTLRRSGIYQGQQMQQVYDRAQNLPRQCNFSQSQQCQIRAIFV